MDILKIITKDNSIYLLLGLFIAILLLIIIFLTVFILYRSSKNKKQQLIRNFSEDLILKIKGLNIIREKGAISQEEFDERKNLLFSLLDEERRLGKKFITEESIEKYCEAAKNTNESIIIIQDGIIKYTNKKTNEIMDFTKNELISNNIFEHIHPNDQKIFMDYQLSKLSNKKSTYQNIFRIFDKTGEIRWIKFNSVKITWEKKIASLNFLEDVTKQKLAENELHEIQDRYHSLFQNSPVSLIELDLGDIKDFIDQVKNTGVSDFKRYFESFPDIALKLIEMTRLIAINNTTLKLFNLKTKNEFVESFNNIIKNEFYNVILDLFINLAEDKISFEINTDYILSNENKRYLNVKVILVSNCQPKLRAIVSIIDVTEQRETTEQFQNLSQFRESIIDNANFWLNVLDKELNVIIWNKAAEKISGYTKEEVMGCNGIWELLFTDKTYREKVLEQIHLITDKAEIIEDLETQITCKNKDMKIISYNFKSLLNNNNETIGLIVMGRDITARKTMEEELKYLATHDSLTGVYNRAFFEKELYTFMSEKPKKIALILLDIDGLKYINDTLGHQYGDNLIRDFSKILMRTFSTIGIVSRIGGDEFSVIITDIDCNEVHSNIAKLKTNFEQYNKTLKKNQAPLHVSLGYAISEYNKKTLTQLFKEADDMLFEGKIPKKEEARKSALAAIKATMLEKDSVTEEHMDRLCNLATSFGKAINLDDGDIEKLVMATELHDIGKVVVPDNILNKNSSLNIEEFEIIKKHSLSGYRIAEATPMIANISEFILYSHERWDGSGYLEGLKGEEIPLLSRMLHIIDAYDVMINDRPYKKAITKKEAIKELKKCSGTQFDPKLVNIFIDKVLLSKKSKPQYEILEFMSSKNNIYA